MGHKKATTMDDGRWSEGHSNSSPCWIWKIGSWHDVHTSSHRSFVCLSYASPV
jgi:hypothetical protein